MQLDDMCAQKNNGRAKLHSPRFMHIEGTELSGERAVK